MLKLMKPVETGCTDDGDMSFGRPILTEPCLCYSIVYIIMVHSGTRSSCRLVDWTWLSSKHLCIFDLHGAVYIKILLVKFFTFRELSMLGLALDLVD